jgi:hypothetical protein
MSISLTPQGGSPLTLNGTFGWIDEGEWNPIAQTLTYLLPDASGESSLLIQESKRAAGRPITLAGALMRSDFDTLRSMAANAPLMSLAMEDRGTLSVRFKFDNGPAVSGEPVVGAIEPPTADDWFDVTCRLIEV